MITRLVARVKRYIVARRIEEVSDEVMTLIHIVLQETFFPLSLRGVVRAFLRACGEICPVLKTDPEVMDEMNNRYYTKLAIRALLAKGKPLTIRQVSRVLAKNGKSIPLAVVGGYIQDYNAGRMQ